MANWIVWFIGAGVLIVLELMTGTFYLLAVSVCLLAGGLVALVSGNVPLQFVVAGIVGLIAGYFAYRKTLHSKSQPEKNSNVLLDIGQNIVVDKWNEMPGGINQARVSYRGALWDVELDFGIEAQPGVFFITEIRGNCLIVGKTKESSNG